MGDDGASVITSYSIHYTKLYDDASDIERVEVLRGPQSVIGGANAASGVISIVTKSGSEAGVHQQASVGVADHGGYHGAYSAQFVGERGKLVITSYSIHYTKLYEARYCSSQSAPSRSR